MTVTFTWPNYMYIVAAVCTILLSWGANWICAAVSCACN